MGILITLILLLIAWVSAKVIWMSGFLSGKNHEAAMWINAIEKLMPPNWQSLLLKEEGMSQDALVMANKLYAAAYRTALDHLKLDIMLVRQEELAKSQREEEPRYPAV